MRVIGHRGLSKGGLLGLAALAAILIIPMSLTSYAIAIAVSLFVYIALAGSYDIVGGYMGYANLGHAAFFGLGAYSFAIAFTTYQMGFLSFVLGLIPSIVFAALIAYPFYRLRGVYFALASLSLLLLMQITATNLQDLTGGFSGMYVTAPVEKRVHEISSFYFALGVALATVYVSYRLSRSKLGRGLVAIREDEEAAEVFGVNTFRYKQMALILSSFLAALAGEAYVWYLAAVNPRSAFGLEIGLAPVVMAMVGGSATPAGPVIGAVMFRIIDETLLPIVPYFHLTIFGFALILVGIFEPNGIAGSRRLRSWLAMIFRRIPIRRRDLDKVQGRT